MNADSGWVWKDGLRDGFRGCGRQFRWLLGGFGWVSVAFEMGSDVLFSWRWVAFWLGINTFGENAGMEGWRRAAGAGFGARSAMPEEKWDSWRGSMRGRSGFVGGSFRGRGRVEWDVFCGKSVCFVWIPGIIPIFFAFRAGGKRCLRGSHDSLYAWAVGAGWLCY